MSAKRIAVLVIVPIAVFAVSVGLFLLLAHPGRAGAAEPPSYTLGEDSGKLALFKTGENTPVTRYEIYTGLLPEQDVAALQQGHPCRHAERAAPLSGGFRRVTARAACMPGHFLAGTISSQ